MRFIFSTYFSRQSYLLSPLRQNECLNMKKIIFMPKDTQISSFFFNFIGFLLPVFLLFLNSQHIAAQSGATVVRGQVTDAQNKETMPYVNVHFEGTTIGTTSDINGNFYLRSTQPNLTHLKVSYIGYKPQVIGIKVGETNTVNISLEAESTELGEVVVKSGKYRNKDNPAVELIRKVIENKSKNRPDGLGYYKYEKYEKVSFAYNNITEKMKNNFIFRNMQFLFENTDTNKVSGKVNLPFFLRETSSEVYYRRNPKSQKEYIHGEKNTKLPGGFDNDGISGFIENMYRDIDIYDDAINLVTLDFVSPLSAFSPSFYRFYILDTTVVKETKAAHVYFAPRNKADLGFMGHMWVALDSTYAVRKIDYGIPKDINLNWVNEMQMVQEFDWIDMPNDTLKTAPSGRGLMLIKDDIFMDFGTSGNEKRKSVIGYKSTSYRNYNINTVLPDSLFRSQANTFRDFVADKQNEQFWAAHRHDSLSKQEKGIAKTIDSLNNYKPFKRFVRVAKFLFEGYSGIGPIDIGPVNTFYSFNSVEGFRMRLGGRTNAKFSKRLMLEGYGAYGFKDKEWKGYGGFRYNFGKQALTKFPLNQLKGWYQNEVQIPGQELQFVAEDNFFLSFKRGINNKMTYNRTIGLEYIKESQNGLTYSFSAKLLKMRPAGQLRFDYIVDGETLQRSSLKTTELGLYLRYAPNEQFYQGATYRTPIRNKYPIIDFWYTANLKNVLGSEYTYHTMRVKAEKMFYLSPIGWSILKLEGGYIYGQVPFPLLTIHRANQTYTYQLESYNLMNFLEFVSDKYISVNYYHNFSGFFFNRVPLFKRLKLREVVTFKALWGGVEDSNIPTAQNGLLLLPTDEQGNPTTFTLEARPYMEASVGVANIFRVLRVDYVRRLTYLDNPNVTKWGIRMRFKIEF